MVSAFSSVSLQKKKRRYGTTALVSPECVLSWLQHTEMLKMECTYILHINDSLNKRKKVENSFGDIEDFQLEGVIN